MIKQVLGVGLDDETALSDESDEILSEKTNLTTDEEEEEKEKPERAGTLPNTYYKAASYFPLLTKQDENKLAKAIKRGDRKARETLICCNLRLVLAVAKRYLNRGLEFDDLVQAGNIGLLEAVKKFNPKKGRFGVYAWYQVRVQMQRELCKKNDFPTYLLQPMLRIARAEAKLIATGKGTDISNIAKLSGLKQSEVINAKMARQKPASLNFKILDDEGSELIDFVAEDGELKLGKGSFDPFTHKDPAEKMDLRRKLNSALLRLTKREREILCRRNGYTVENSQNSGEGLEKETLDKIGKDFGFSRERIRQLENEIKAKIREGRIGKALREIYNQS